MINRQLELGLENRPACGSPRRRPRSGRANWWFQRMRGLVEEARDWEPAKLPGENRVVALAENKPSETQISSQPANAAIRELPEPRFSQGNARWKFVRIRGLESE